LSRFTRVAVLSFGSIPYRTTVVSAGLTDMVGS
jgi:hypothetical protein